MKKLKYNSKKNKGITIIALVVTIIILIILAGVSINLTLGDNGLITMAKMAKENMQLAQTEEQDKLNELYKQIEKGGEFEGDITVGELQQTIDDLKETVDNLTNQLEDEQAQKKELEQKIEELKSQLQQEQTEKEELERQIEELNTELETAKSKEAELQQQVTEKDKEIERLESELQSKNEQLASKDKTIQDLTSSKNELEKRVEELQNLVNTLQQQIEALQAKQAIGNATEADVLAGKTFSNSNGVNLVGSMPNNKIESKTLNAGQSYTIPKGYHDGTGTVTANSLASQTPGTATADDIVSGKKAWVNGSQITGTGENLQDNPKLLWTNPSTSGTFIAQTINLDLSNYDAIIISFTARYTYKSLWYFIIPIGITQGVNVSMNGDTTNQGANAWYRIITTTTSGVSIGNALNVTDQNHGVIPREIYGLKNFK